jgi:molybdopterin-guanine dinucleotide biosynthesis protein A
VTSVSSDRLLEDCTGVLVAGGRGARLGGVAKGLLTLDGEPLAARAVAVFRRVFPAIVLVANDPEPYEALGVRTVPDRIPGKGAPGGLHAALAAATTPWVFTAGCDMPFLGEAPIRYLAAHRGEGSLAVVPVWNGIPQPLHAFWSTAALPLVQTLLAAGDPSLQAVVRESGAHLVTEEEWRSVDPRGLAFENANTPADLIRLGLARPQPGG